MRSGFFKPSIAAALLSLLVACTTPDSEWKPLNPGFGLPKRHCGTEGPDTYYFPSQSLEDGYGSDEFFREWYSAHLTAMKEPSLSCGASNADETYRFLWLRSFHNPVTVRITRREQQYTLTATVLDGAGGYRPGKVVRHFTKRLSETEWRKAVAEIDELGFWTVSSKPTDTDITIDGAQWIIEGKKDAYHVVDRWGGGDGVGAVGLSFLELADLKRYAKPVY